METTILEQGIELQELGFEKKSDYHWGQIDVNENTHGAPEKLEWRIVRGSGNIPALTTSELLDIIHSDYGVDKVNIISKSNGYVFIENEDFRHESFSIEQALGEMLIYYMKENLSDKE